MGVGGSYLVFGEPYGSRSANAKITMDFLWSESWSPAIKYTEVANRATSVMTSNAAIVCQRGILMEVGSCKNTKERKGMSITYHVPAFPTEK